MRSTTLTRIAALLTLLGLGAIAVPAQQQQQPDPSQQSSGDPVADAARKSREQQKTAPKPKHVFTNDDMPAAADKPAAATKPDGTPADANADQATADKDKDGANDPKSEAYWRKRFTEAHNKLATAEKELDVLQRELNKNQVQYYPDPQKALMQQYNRSDINSETAKIDAKQKEIDALKQHISDMEDELRKAGGDPGWAR
jgi:chromosome segregation ATPase